MAKGTELCLMIFTTARSTQYLSTPPSNLPCLVFESSNTLLTYTWLWQTGQQHSSFFFLINTLLHIRLSFGVVHSIIIYSTISKIIVRPGSRNRTRTGGTRQLQQRGLSKLRLCFLQPDLSLKEWVTLPARVSVHASQLSLSPSHELLQDLMENTNSKSLLGY